MLTPEKQEELYNSVKRIEIGLYGDEQAGIKGLVQRVNDNEGYIKKAKKVSFITIGIGMAVMFLLNQADSIAKFFNHK